MPSRVSALFARTSGMPLLVGLLVVTFAIAGDLAHEAWTTARAQRETADRALRDFVRYAATSLSLRAEANVGAAIAPLVAGVEGAGDEARLPGPEALAAAAARIRACRCAPDLRSHWYFRIPLGGGASRVAGDSAPAPDEVARVTAAVVADAHRARGEAGTRRGAIGAERLLLDAGAAPPRIIAYVLRGAASRDDARWAYGAVTDAAAFGDAVFAPIVREEIRAPVLAGRALPADSLVATTVHARSGALVYDVDSRWRAPRLTMVPRAGHETYVAGPMPNGEPTGTADTVHLAPRFGGLVLDVALTAGASRLLAADVPRSRLLVVLGLLVLMAGLVGVAVLQLRREHELARLRAEFTAAVSHELRTPLAQILLYGETLMLERTRSDRERRGAAEVIVREARRLMHLVENALHYARTERRFPRFAPERAELGRLTREILVAFAPLARNAHVAIAESLDDDAHVLIDPAAFRQMLLNLLDNAVKYGPTGQTVRVAVERSDRGRTVRLTVDDEGRGVPSPDREKIWDPFVRMTATRSGTLGAGIGLAIVRDLAHRHGGRTWVEDAPAGGARFVIALPAHDGVTDELPVETRARSARRP